MDERLNHFPDYFGCVPRVGGLAPISGAQVTSMISVQLWQEIAAALVSVGFGAWLGVKLCSKRWGCAMRTSDVLARWKRGLDARRAVALTGENPIVTEDPPKK